MSSAAPITLSTWHIPELVGPSYPRPEIPCLCEVEDYDKRGMIGFPARTGWTIDDKKGPVRLDGTETPPERVARFLQTWLFFGMLHDILLISGVDVDLKIFIQYHGIDPFITTAPLRQLLADMLGRGEDRTRAAYKEFEMSKVFSAVQGFFHGFMDSVPPTQWRIRDVLPLDTAMSILILSESLLNAAIITLRAPRESVLRNVAFFHTNNPLEERMLNRGWCISTVKMLHDSLDHTGLYTASLLRFSSITGRQSHQGCTVESCRSNFVSEATYQTSHTEACQAQGSSGCFHISVDIPKVCSILRRGGIPVVNIIACGKDNEDIELAVVESSPYVAISHVWAQGLGNVRANSLPRCQLFHLRAATRELVLQTSTEEQVLEQPAIWIDTLCIPVHPDLKEDRKAAIVSLGKIFKEASQVLVLDADMQTCPKNASRLERGTRLQCAGWMRRLWTYQEAVISEEGTYCGKLQIQFSDGALPFASMAGKQGLTTLCHTQKTIAELWLSLPLTGDPTSLFKRMCRALRYRSTSRVEDESICLGSVLGYDLKELSETKCPNQRMALFYSYIPEIPADIIFLRKDKLEIDGYRWAPKSLLKQARSLKDLALYQKDFTTRDAEGLYVTHSGFRITDVALPTTPGRHFYIKRSHQAEPEGELMYSIPIEHPAGVILSTRELQLRDEKRIQFDNLVHVTERLAVIQNPREEDLSLLVTIVREEAGTIFCRYLHMVHSSSMPRIQLSRGSLVVQHLAPEQRWCVG
ncbi:hypothetical protein DFP73DRAFT_634592 [Morchella snyderi]|nr:hypothetical protein DFP73DRAFT_634592 [Morchella snyderi]